jgi:hypothetical protein
VGRLTFLFILASSAILGISVEGVGSMTRQPSRHGFRRDPMQYVEQSDSLQAALTRRLVFRKPRPGDDAVLARQIDEILAAQSEDGALSDDPQHRVQFTAERLIDLAELGVDPKRPEVERAVGLILRRKDEQTADALGIYTVRALCLLGMVDRREVKAGLQALIEAEDEWNGPDRGCPWTPVVHLKTLWDGRRIADHTDLIADSLGRIADRLNDAGCLGYKDPWGFVDIAGMVDGPAAERIVRRELPMILRAQREDGGWGDHSLIAFRALETHGLFAKLRDLPPLPPDWEVVRSIPAPEGDLWGLVFDGRNLWTKDHKLDEVIALSPVDGRVLRRLRLSVGKSEGLGLWDGKLAVAQCDPKRVLQVDPESGAILREFPVKYMVEPVAVMQVNGKLWVSDGWLFPGNVADPNRDPAQPQTDPFEPGTRLDPLLAGPLALHFAPTADGVWHQEYWVPLLIESGPNGTLLDWGEKPFGDATAGIAWDGEHLLALDGKEKRICVIDKHL